MEVQGTDGSTFPPLLDADSELWVFEPDAMKSIPLAYKEVRSRWRGACAPPRLTDAAAPVQPLTIHDLPAMRFVARADAFDHGGINLTNLATIRVRPPRRGPSSLASARGSLT